MSDEDTPVAWRWREAFGNGAFKDWRLCSEQMEVHNLTHYKSEVQPLYVRPSSDEMKRLLSDKERLNKENANLKAFMEEHLDCPYPCETADRSAKACFSRGECGCCFKEFFA